MNLGAATVRATVPLCVVLFLATGCGGQSTASRGSSSQSPGEAFAVARTGPTETTLSTPRDYWSGIHLDPPATADPKVTAAQALTSCNAAAACSAGTPQKAELSLLRARTLVTHRSSPGQ